MQAKTGLFLLTLIAVSLAVHVVYADTPAPVDVQAILRERVEGSLNVGVVVAIIEPEGTKFHSYGTLAKSSDRKIDEDTIFEIGSVTKVFTALLLIEMVERGEVDLEDPVAKYLPDSVKIPTMGEQPITLQHLVMHTSGLPHMPDDAFSTGTENLFAEYTAPRLYEFLSDFTPRQAPGAMWVYSDLGVGLLGHVLSLKAGMDYEKLVATRICDELGMKSTGITLSDSQKKHLATGYHDDAEVPRWEFHTFAGTGGLRSSARDLAAFVAASMGLKETKLYAPMQKMEKMRVGIRQRFKQQACGWYVHSRFDKTLFTYGGGTGGSRAFIGFSKERKTGVVVLSNSSTDIKDIGMHLLEEQYKLRKVRKSVTIDPRLLDDYVGRYTPNPHLVCIVTREGDKLMIEAAGSGKLELLPESESSFFMRVMDGLFSFVRDEDGKVNQLTLRQGGRENVATKIDPKDEPVEAKIDPKILDAYVGKYKSESGVLVTVVKRNGRLTVRLPQQAPMTVYPKSETEFFYKLIMAELEFTKDEEGKVKEFVLQQGGRELRATRLEN
jgi:CubicO group peptidase (beta-lactamase class C family)